MENTNETKCEKCGSETKHKVYEYPIVGKVAECDICTNCNHEQNRETF